tara:strand:- start:2711 stop:2881 length:171 start_codon:yes stop_codon:yes gene_type:complete
MDEENKIVVDAVAGGGTFAAWMGMVPDFVAVFTGAYVLIRIWETETIKKLTGRGDV